MSLNDIDMSFQLISPTSIFYPSTQLQFLSTPLQHDSASTSATGIDTSLRPLDAISTSLLSIQDSSPSSLTIPSIPSSNAFNQSQPRSSSPSPTAA